MGWFKKKDPGLGPRRHWTDWFDFDPNGYPGGDGRPLSGCAILFFLVSFGGTVIAAYWTPIKEFLKRCGVHLP
jgi:hypothetical protein